MGELPVTVKPFGLVEGSFIPAEIQPGESVQNGGNGFLGGAFAVCVFDAEDESPFVMPGQKKVE